MVSGPLANGKGMVKRGTHIKAAGRGLWPTSNTAKSQRTEAVMEPKPRHSKYHGAPVPPSIALARAARSLLHPRHSNSCASFKPRDVRAIIEERSRAAASSNATLARLGNLGWGACSSSARPTLLAEPVPAPTQKRKVGKPWSKQLRERRRPREAGLHKTSRAVRWMDYSSQSTMGTVHRVSWNPRPGLVLHRQK